MSTSVLYGAEAAVAADRTRDAGPDRPSTPTTAPDVPSARIAARLSGKRVEALAERTETSTTWVNPDGDLTTELTAGPVRFRDAFTGDWRQVDLDLAANPDGSVEPKAHPHRLRLGAPGGRKLARLSDNAVAAARDLVTLGEGDQQVTLQWKGGLPAPKLDDNRATYENAVPDGDLVVEATRTGFEQYVRINKRPAAEGYTYTLPLKAKGLKVEQQGDGSLLFLDKKNKKQAVMPAPVMWDASVDKVSGESAHRAKAQMKVVRHGGTIDLVITPDAKFLADPATRYPVTVDPSTASLGNVFDTYVQQGETVDWSTDTELDLGNPGTKNADGTFRTARSFITWNTAPISDALVTSATLSLWNFHSGNTDCVAYPWEVWSAGKASTASRWTAQPAWTAKKATSTETKGNPGCTSAPDGWINANVSTLVQEWASAKAATSGMGLRATDESVTAQWKRVNSANAASNPPKLVVTYNYRPRTGTKQEAGPPYFSYSGSYVVNTATPTLRDTFVDPNGDKVNGTFEIRDAVTDTQVGTYLVSPWTPSGQVASVTVPAGVLTNGKTYKFRTSPYDGTHYNLGWSAWKNFTVDTSAPSAPTAITSTDYPSNAWVKGGGQAGVFNVTPPAADHNWLEWSLDGVTWTKVATGGTAGAKAVTVTPPRDGNHTLQVRSVDKADNKSEPLEYAFHAGPGGFVQPAEGTRTARRLPLVAEADASKYDAVSFSWRRSAADAWTPVPAGDVTQGGTALTAWPVALTGGKSPALTWNATDTVDPDGSIEIKADFTGPNAAAGSTDPLAVVVDRNAGVAATETVGPGSVNLLTGDYTLTEADVKSQGLSVERSASSRTPGAVQEGQLPIFGKEWVAGTPAELTGSDYAFVQQLSATAVDVVTSDGTPIHFTADAGQTGWIPEPGSETLTLTGSVTGSFTLTDSEGVTTAFTKPAGATTWQLSSTGNQGQSDSTSTVESSTVTVGGKQLARPVRVFAPTSATTVAACKANPSTKGCRVLEYVYATATTATSGAFGDFVNQVKEIKLWSTASGAAAATAKTVQSYAYDDSGRLRETWDTQITPAVKTAYDYDAAGRVTKLTPPGELAWNFTYGKAGSSSAAGDGMLLNVSRAGLKQGTTDVVEGNAVTTLVYDVPLSGAAAPYQLGTADVKRWAQTDAPSDATAVFPADSVPSSNDGGTLTAGAYTRATVHYMGTSGRTVDKAEPGGDITTTEYDRFGNTVRELTAANREVAIGTSAAAVAARTGLGIAQLTEAERADLLSTSTVYDARGTRELEEFGPLRRIDLTADLKSGATTLVAAGTPVTARSWKVTSYDEGRPTDGSAVVKDQVTHVTTGAQVREHPTVQGEARTVETQYDWAKGLPVKTIEDPAGLALTTTTEYDAQGRVTKVIQPGGTGTDATTKVTTYWSATGTGACQGRPEWADMICSTGPAGAVTGGGSNPTTLPVKTFEYDWWGITSKVTETSGATTRTTTTTTDAAGRVASVSTTGGLGQATPATTAEYDPATGRETRTVSPTGGTLTTVYDKLGRPTSYTDADGGTTTTEYDLLGRKVKTSNSVPSSVTYTYDHAAEPRGLVTKAVDSVAGTFTASYDADGALVSEQLPGGYTLKQSFDPTGTPVERAYTRDSDGVLVQSDTTSRSIHGQVTTDAQDSEQVYGYDAVGRLTSVEDTAETVCTKRTYAFDGRSNRTSLTTATGTPGADCPTSGGTTTSTTYDSADRQSTAGYVYDAFGRTTAKPGGVALGYYTNDRVYQETLGSQRQTWKLDGSQRIRSWTVESNSGGTWTQTQSKVNHYDCGCDRPSWVLEDSATGTVTRNVDSLGGGLAATTSKTGNTVLQLSDIHGDVSLQLPLDTSVAPTVLDTDEYGNTRAGSKPARYDWLGSQQRSGDTLSGLTLMGARLYDPATGRFLQADPAAEGGANAYGYPADPVTMYDLGGKWWWSESTWWKIAKCAWAIIEVAMWAGGVGWLMKAYKIRQAVRIIRRVGFKRMWNMIKALRNTPRRRWWQTARHVGAGLYTAFGVLMGFSSVQEDCWDAFH
ncbi:DNRLRE domain-containing protein [Streptomyces sp. NRRL S-87]|uniref:DNRLRE domain-containing protein n=1 Tax=Streptomyces sp. NRRL S-87 TaxID=1463920 RepID=UPI00099DD92D|nr:DNRLRE domain-containing protein [Streptomyces sp. NRRL S-87]